MNDWKQIHKRFDEQTKKINEYLTKQARIINCDWCLVYSKTKVVLEYELLSFTIGVLLDDNKLTILRDVSISISPLLFISYRKGSGIEGCFNISQCLSAFGNFKKDAVIQFSCSNKKEKLYSFKVDSTLNIADDIGPSETDFEGCNFVRSIKVPTEITNRTYPSVGSFYHAPHSTTDFDCILFAQLSNPFDTNAVEVRRWFPHEREDEFPMRLPYSYAYGFISKAENADLHKFMIENNCRILFGKVTNNKITIYGSVDVFKNKLSAYHLPYFILNPLYPNYESQSVF